MKIPIGGIYMIRHAAGKYYIGMSKDIFRRWDSHYINVKIQKHSSIEFQELWNSTNPNEWTFQILEHLSLTDLRSTSKMVGVQLGLAYRTWLLDKEKEWMAKYPVEFCLNKDKKHFLK